MKRRADSRLGIAETLGLQAQLQERLGNLAEAKRLGAEQADLAEPRVGAGSQGDVLWEPHAGPARVDAHI